MLKFLIIQEPLRIRLSTKLKNVLTTYFNYHDKLYSQVFFKIIDKTDIFCSKRLHLCLIYKNTSYNIKGDLNKCKS